MKHERTGIQNMKGGEERCQCLKCS